VPHPVLLFRYSAWTFNGHGIHCDRPYAKDLEHCPGLVVHGPLIATLLLETLRRHVRGVVIRSFEFKMISQLFDTAPFDLCGRIGFGNASLWARGPEGDLAMQATARILQP
jgi:3-methylfumaryl-CoA hydratase